MSNDRKPQSHLDDSHAIDQLCDEFENQWQSVGVPDIAKILETADPSIADRLFEQLLPLELDLRKTQPSIDEYVARFPDRRQQIENVFSLYFEIANWEDASIGPFRIHGEIARGGMGIVYEASDTRLGRKVAIKLLTTERRNDSQWLKRFRREAKLASGLNHPNILTIYDIGEENGIPYIASEHVEGITLRTRMAGNSLPIRDSIDIASQIARGMLAAHSSSIIHRDLKPDNIMIRNDGIVKILDFGLAKTNQTNNQFTGYESQVGGLKGTVHFMSPEQARGFEVDTPSDVFSFGILLYLMFSGKQPFSGQSGSDVIAAILNATPVPISSFHVDIPNGLKGLVANCLNKLASKRPTFQEILEQLESCDRELETSYNESNAKSHGGSTLGTEGGDTETDGPDNFTVVSELNASSELKPSEIRYAQSGEVNIAWQEIGSGPIDIVFVMGWVSHLDWFWKDPSFSAFLKRLARFSRVILFDKRGTGLSDRVPLNQLPTLEIRMDDVRAVLEAAGSKRAVLCGVSEGGPLCALFAATYPEKTIAIVMIGCYARRLWADDYPWGPTAEQREVFLQEIAKNWGGPLGIEDRAPSKAKDPEFRQWWASYLRMGASPAAAVALTKMNAQIDVRPILPTIQVPTLVIHRTDDKCLLLEEGRLLASKIPGAKFVELPGADHLPFVGDSDGVLNEVELFLTGMSRVPKADRVLATVLMVQVVEMDHDKLNQLITLTSHEISLFRGQNFQAKNNLIMVTFDGPVRAVRCAKAISALAGRLDLNVKCGIDTGTCNILDSQVSGPAVDSATLVSGVAATSGVLVTETVKNLVSGSELVFAGFESPLGLDLPVLHELAE